MRALVTGGSRGIGKAIVDLFVSSGLSVYSPSRSELDLTQPIDLQHREFDIVINCAGINPIKRVDSVTDDLVMRVNYSAPLEIIQQCLPHMIKHNYGRIVNIGSVWIENTKPGRLAYSASKNALHALTKSITAEYAHLNIVANTVSPGFIATDLTFENNTSKEISKITQSIPANRLGQPQEVARLVYQLTVENSFINGQNIIIDGGFSCTRY